MKIKESEKLFKALGNVNRIVILGLLEKYVELSIKEIAGKLGIHAQSASEHLRVLQRAGMVKERKDGMFIKFRLSHTMKDSIEKMTIWDCVFG